MDNFKKNIVRQCDAGGLFCPCCNPSQTKRKSAQGRKSASEAKKIMNRVARRRTNREDRFTWEAP